jgi:hypothetical protein
MAAVQPEPAPPAHAPSGAAPQPLAEPMVDAGAHIEDAKVSTESTPKGREPSVSNAAMAMHWSREDGNSDFPGDPGQGASDKSNLRDLAGIQGTRLMREGRIFRCSQFHSQELRCQLSIKCILDLRKSGKQCTQPRRRLLGLIRPDWALKRLRNLAPAAVAPRCPNCEGHLNKGLKEEGVHLRRSCRCCCVLYAAALLCVAHGVQTPHMIRGAVHAERPATLLPGSVRNRRALPPQVYHIDFTTPEFQYNVFTSMPRKSAAFAVGSKLICRDPSAAMAGVVADPDKFGYGKLYTFFLEYAKTQIARAFRIMGDAASYPTMMHCIHGCVAG